MTFLFGKCRGYGLCFQSPAVSQELAKTDLCDADRIIFQTPLQAIMEALVGGERWDADVKLPFSSICKLAFECWQNSLQRDIQKGKF